MASTKYDKKPEPGDLIEIFRSGYQHWAIYVGDGYVIHLAPPSEFAQAGAYSVKSLLSDRAIVKKEELYEVLGNDKYNVNNLLDGKYKPRPIQDVLRDAQRLLGMKLPYDIVTNNCEHFVTELRYGKPESRQVQKAMVIAGAAVAGTGFIAASFAVIKAFFGSKDTEKY
ncbi:phospholipase A and acyltransferase 3-like [Siphateles boraxobius]|uniref:phospholipase A and acyltransferase 3-like n=1 Tax=Siphateles boraxobius TaxID=180520 RepID=UPI0040632662